MIGRNLLNTNTGGSTRVSADGQPQYKMAGITIDWTTVAALGVDTTYGDGGVYKAGQKVLRYGQVMTKITASGKFGPYDSAAVDGRQNLNRGDCFILDTTQAQYKAGSDAAGAANDQIGDCIDGGAVFIDRVLHSGVAAHSLAAGPTLAELLAAFPLLEIVRN